MKIDSASYSLAASHLATTYDESRESSRSWRGNRRPDFEGREKAAATAVSLSSKALAALAADLRGAMAALPTTQAAAKSSQASAIQEAREAIDNDPMLKLIRSMMEMLTGKAMRVFSARDLQAVAGSTTTSGSSSPTAASAPSAGFGIEYDYHAVHEEFEQTQFSAQGSIKTADGMEISFQLELSMTRTYREETSFSVRAGDAVRNDPLVLNFEGTAAQLTDQRFAFDLDGNGAAENLALLRGGSGYLALDRDGNGKIDSGLELFGPATDSGFAELAKLDDDGNGWIDENDAAFSALRIWSPTATGDGELETLARRQVGAIALGNVATAFELRGAGNSDLGAIKASSVFLTEDGRVGSIQEIDLTV